MALRSLRLIELLWKLGILMWSYFNGGIELELTFTVISFVNMSIYNVERFKV